MIRQEIDIDGYWLVTVIYLPQYEHIGMVAEAFRKLGCKESDIATICHLVGDEWNKGATFTNSARRRTVTVIGRSTSWKEFFNTVMHETKHIVDDIVMSYNMMNYGEPPAYLQGEIGRQMAPVIKRLSCPCCGLNH